MNLNLKIVALFDDLDRRIRELAKEVAKKQQKGDKGEKGDKGDTGPKGKDGAKGKDGINGVNGQDGRNGIDGKDGKDGVDGKNGIDGVGVTDAYIGEDNHLYLEMSDGEEIDAGEINVDFRVGISGGSSGNKLQWIDYSTNWSQEPVLEATITGGEVYRYVYEDGTLYRFVPTDYTASVDAFYRSFDGTNLTGLVAQRGMKIS